MNWTIEFLPFLPIPYLVAAGLVALLIAFFLLLRGRRGVFLRILTLALLITALANPNLKDEERENVVKQAPATLASRRAMCFGLSRRLLGRDGRRRNLGHGHGRARIHRRAAA